MEVSSLARTAPTAVAAEKRIQSINFDANEILKGLLGFKPNLSSH